MKNLIDGALGFVTSKAFLALVAIATVLAAAMIVIAKNRDNRLVETGREAGASGAVAEGQRDILDQVERANDAENEIVRSGDAGRYERCLRNATDATRPNCERFRPLPD